MLCNHLCKHVKCLIGTGTNSTYFLFTFGGQNNKFINTQSWFVTCYIHKFLIVWTFEKSNHEIRVINLRDQLLFS